MSKKFEEKLWMKQPKNIRRHYNEGVNFWEVLSIFLIVVGLIMLGLSMELKSINNFYSVGLVIIGGLLLYFNFKRSRGRIIRIRGQKKKIKKKY